MAVEYYKLAHLLGVAPGIRNTVYKHTFRSTKELQALLTCRQIYNEAAVLASAATQFEVRVIGDKLVQQIIHLPDKFKSAIENVVIAADTAFNTMQQLHSGGVFPTAYVMSVIDTEAVPQPGEADFTNAIIAMTSLHLGPQIHNVPPGFPAAFPIPFMSFYNTALPGQGIHLHAALEPPAPETPLELVMILPLGLTDLDYYHCYHDAVMTGRHQLILLFNKLVTTYLEIEEFDEPITIITKRDEDTQSNGEKVISVGGGDNVRDVRVFLTVKFPGADADENTLPELESE